jgi:hypothetical protein
MYVIAWIIVGVAVIMTAWLCLISFELLRLAYWKQKRCGSCGNRYAFPGWNFGDWQNTYVFHAVVLEDFPNDECSQGVVCPHCGARNRTGKGHYRVDMRRDRDA